MNSFFSRIGGKRLLKNIIVSLFPPKDKFDLYVEAFVGGGWVFLNQETEHEVINDLDKFVYDMWHDLQKTSVDVIKRMDFTPSEERFYYIRDHPNQYNRLFRNLFLSYYSYGARRKNYNNIDKRKASLVIDKLLKVKERLKGVKIENKDYVDVVKKYDSARTLFYFDPPYYQTYNNAYSNGEIDYEKLATIMKTMKGYAVLSINDKPEMRKVFNGLRIKKLSVRNQMVKDDVVDRKELVIMNY